MIKHYLMLLIGLGISVSAAVVEKPAAARLQEYNNYIVTFYEVDGVPKEFNKKCREELDLCPEDAPGTDHNFHFGYARTYGAMAVYQPEKSEDSQRLKRYYQTIVTQAFARKIDAIAARDLVNKDRALLGYVYYGKQDKRIALKRWQRKWTALKQKMGPADINELGE